VVGEEQVRYRMVATLDDPQQKARGVVIRLGQFCQGLMMVDDEVELERWVFAHDGGWTRVAKLGSRVLPCGWVLNPGSVQEGDTLKSGEMLWTLTEKVEW